MARRDKEADSQREWEVAETELDFQWQSLQCQPGNELSERAVQYGGQ